MREFKTDFGLVFGVKQDKACVFCDNCTDIWYDSHGPYMVSCKFNHSESDDHNMNGTCADFVEEVTE